MSEFNVMDGSAVEIAAGFLATHRGKERLLLCFGPSTDPSVIRPVFRYRHRHRSLPLWRQPQLSSDSPEVDYDRLMRERDMMSIVLVDPHVIRVPDRSDPRENLALEMALRQTFQIRDDEERIILLGKDGQVYGSYVPPVFLDDILADIDRIDDT